MENFDLEKLRNLFNKDVKEIHPETYLSLCKKNRYEELLDLLKDKRSLKYYNSTVFKRLGSVYIISKKVQYLSKSETEIETLEFEQYSTTEFSNILKINSFFRWYFEYYDVNNYNMVIIPNCKDMILEKKKQINMCSKLKEHEYKDNYTNEIKNKVDFLLENYLKEIVCQGVKDEYDLLLDYISKPIQGKKSDIALYLYSHNYLQGTGKSTLLSIMIRLIGIEAICCMRGDSLESRFNKPLIGKRFACIDDFTPTEKAMDTEKGMITGDIYEYEGKGKDSLCLPCITTFMNTSNTLPKEVKGQRRYFLLTPKSDWKGKTEKWDKLYSIINDDDCISYLHKILMERVTVDSLQSKLENLKSYKQGRKESTPYVYQFIMSNYFNPELYIDDLFIIKRSIFNKRFEDYMMTNGKNKQGEMNSTNLLSAIGITPRKTNGDYVFDLKLSKLTKKLKNLGALNDDADDEETDELEDLKEKVEFWRTAYNDETSELLDEIRRLEKIAEKYEDVIFEMNNDYEDIEDIEDEEEKQVIYIPEKPKTKPKNALNNKELKQKLNTDFDEEFEIEI